MRNLKKFLALALAMVMTFSLMLSASAAVKYSDYKDTADVTPAFEEAVKVLTGLEVLQGDGEEGNKNFRPQDDITRAEAAAVVYRVITGDIKDAQVALYKDYGRFADVNENDWFAGYVGYCQNAGIIKGTTPTTFSPYAKVTGYEVLAMILRAVGYGKNNEFTGDDWRVKVASLAKTKHITDSVSSAQYDVTLNTPARREIVAELVFRGIQIPQVELTALGYSEYKNAMEFNGVNPSLAWEVFGLADTGWKVIDKWGNPGYEWTAYRNPAKNRVVATIEAKPTYEFHDLQRECDVAHALDDEDFTSWLYVNSKDQITKEYKIVATDTVTKVGGYGRQVKVYTAEDLKKQSTWVWTSEYYDSGRVWDDDKSAMHNVVTMVDTMLAKVVSTTEVVKDKADHVITPAKLTVDVYGTNHDYNTPERRTIAKSDDKNWDYSRGSVILLNAYTNHGARSQQIDKEKAAFETDPLVATLEQGKNVVIIDPPTSVTGKQTLVYWNEDKHQVAGEDKIDALTLDLNAAGTNINTTYVWYFDQYGYLVGIDEVANQRYGVITSVYAAFDQGETSTTGTAKAVATVQYADGTTGTETIDFFMVHGAAPKTRGTISDVMPDTSDANLVQLWPVYDINEYDPMEEAVLSTIMPNVTLKPSLVPAAQQGAINMAPVAASNTNGAKNGDANNLHGVLNNNLFKFVKSANDQTVAIEVAGGDTTYTNLSGNATGSWYDGHWAAEVDSTGGGKLYKTLAYLNLDENTSTSGKIAAWLDNETQIIFRDYTTGKITVYNGVSALPGDIVIDKDDKTGDNACNANEVDWADTDGDGRAEVVYLTGTLEGLITYGLFYFNGGASSWNGTTGTATGWLNGEAATLTFTDVDMLDLIRNARNFTGTEGYDGHLFAVKQFNGTVVDVLGKDETGTTANLLMEYSTDGFYNVAMKVIDDFESSIKNDAGKDTGSVATDDFKCGGNSGQAEFGNKYTDNTEAVYYKDVKNVSADTYNLTFTPDTLGGRITVSQDGSVIATYHTNPTTKMYGIGSGVTEGIAALAYLNEYDENDVTIVYENSGATDHAILEIYVAIDPDITPSNRPNPGTPAAAQATGVGSDVTAFRATDIADDDAWKALLRIRPNTGAYYWNDTDETNPFSASAKNNEVIVVPFINPTGAADLTVSYTVRDSEGNIVYTENGTTIATGTTVGTDAINGVHVFSLDFSADSVAPDTTANNAPGVWWNGTKGLTEGTYTLVIQVALQEVYSCTFTLT